MIESCLRSLLLSDATIAGLVGSRVFPMFKPEGQAYPAVVYQRVDGEHPLAQDGPAGRGVAVLQISALAESYETAKTLQKAIVSLLHGYRGGAGSCTFYRCEVRGLADGMSWEGETFVHQLDVEIDYREAL